MDNRNSKRSMLAEIRRLGLLTERYREQRVNAQAKLLRVYDQGLWGIAYVGAENYAYRESYARRRLKAVMNDSGEVSDEACQSDGDTNEQSL